MHYRKLQADKIFNGFNWMDDDLVLIVDETGRIENIVSKEHAGEGIEYLDGILTPGFINAHCHLELSHLRNTVTTHTGLVDFLLSVIKNRTATKEEILEHIATAEKEMYDNGIVAVADICNTDHTVAIKKQSRLKWYNLIEVINPYDSNWPKQLQKFKGILNVFEEEGKMLTPHSPYSVSAGAFAALNELTAQSIISIHNQETSAENDLFLNGQGEFVRFYRSLGEAGSPFPITGKSSLQTWLLHFTKGQTILLVHNTFISEDDILFAKAHEEKYGLKLVYCLCPNANLYIESKLPPVELLLKYDCKIVLGTDSYSSNWQLSIAAEIKTLQDHFPALSLGDMLQWATSNGAETLNQSSLGKFEKGNSPGIVLLETSVENKNIVTGISQRIV
jgi:aminodeoxyfutalosine deaminase